MSSATATLVTQEEASRQSESNTQGKSAIQAISQGLTLPGVPSFTSIDKKRRWMLEHMAGAFRVFARKGFSEGMSGHISLRDPEHPDCFWTNPLGLHFGLVKVSDLILLNHAGEPVGGNRSRPANAAGFQIHGVLHKMYPRVNAACHAHSKHGKAWSTFAKPLDMINQDVTMFYGDAQAVYPEFGGVVLETEESLRLGRHLGDKGKLLILRNHGLLTVGETVDEAAYLFTLAERSCEIQLQVDAAAAQGMEKKLIEPEAAEFTFKMTSDPEALYCEFQPDYEMELEQSNGRFLQ
ncbi:class II aldolase/adducin domain-containing protein [Aspergillus sclerotioniger CBS 115572]|uniref:Class II aldolase/adducin domain-containing protein n=1 Tax=Aspergillus sclerotioniger CBS 115572 TaxID=1450535 RepID=A0A317X3Q1_9EURO|nr:class II aldolase/adducin domain-containing protein [Aspergillus sclerotioniger CBS 115572]PWY92975.1 class II aldolase/adducin domain-containing protein [Aspergillus sclerotioniger CBS 115572]